MAGDFVNSFAQRLRSEFDCSEETALRIAKHAERHHRNTGVERTQREWVGLLKEIEAETLVERWKVAIGSDTADS